MANTFTKRIDNGIRDLFDWFDDAWHVSTDLERIGVLSGSPNTISGISLRFIGVNVTKNATISSAKITFRCTNTRSNQAIKFRIYGVAEDNTGEFTTSPIDDARTRSHTTAYVDWQTTISVTSGSDFDSADITSIIQEIVNRAGWVSGNALAISIQDNGASAGNYVNPRAYEWDTANGALLTIVYAGSSPSSSVSSSVSSSASPSSSLSPSSSISPSASVSRSPSPTPPPPFFGLRIAKAGFDARGFPNANQVKFSSEYGTLKYFTKQTVNISFDASTGDISAKGTYTHNKNKYLFAEAYVRVYIGSTPGGNYEPVPFFGSGATVAYSANMRINKNTIELFGQINGLSSLVWHFDFLLFVYQNDLKL